MRRFGSQITFEYFDIFEDYDAVQKFPNIVMFLSRQPSLPVVALDGVPKLMGGVPVGKISELLTSMGLTANEGIPGK